VEAGEIFDRFSGYVALAACASLLLLLPLYFSQRRDLQRLRVWRLREPDHPAGDLEASELLLDRAEAELEELLGEPEPEPGTTPATPMPAATRVTHERPALERITMERSALAPHPRWRRFAGRATQPRVLLALGLAALLLAGAGIFVSEQLLSDKGDGRQARSGAVDPAEVTVAVLNGTSVNGLAGKVGSDLESAGYELGAITSALPGLAKTTVLYAVGEKPAAQKVARELGLDPAKVEPVDRKSRGLAGGADVIVIAGEDRAS
jgi:hypothetical protein